MDLELFKKIGLSQGERSIYGVLLDMGELPASTIIEQSGLKKGDCYNKIYALIDKGLLEEFEKGKKKHFRLSHPNRIGEFVEQQEREIVRTKKELQAIMPSILSSYNLSYHQPGVKVFEGEVAVDILMRDSLKAHSDILSYIDLESIDRHLSKRSAWYTKNRQKLGLKKYNLIFDSPYNRELVKKKPLDMTYERIIDLGSYMKDISMQIYDNKIVYHNLNSKHTIGVIIEDEVMANLQRQMWYWMWERA